MSALPLTGTIGLFPGKSPLEGSRRRDQIFNGTVVFKKLINRYFDELAHRSSFLNRRFFQQSYKSLINCNTDMFFYNTKVLQIAFLVKWRTSELRAPNSSMG